MKGPQVWQRLTRPLVILVAIAATVLCTGAQDGQREALDKWFDGLTFSQYVRAPFVKLTTHRGDDTYDSYGLLVSPPGQQIVLVGLDQFKTIYRSDKQTSYTVEGADFRAWILALRKKFLAESASGAYRVSNIPSSFDQDQVFFASRIARGRGMKDIEDLCYKWAKESEVYLHISDAEHFEANLREAFARKLLWDAILQVGDYRIARQDIVPQLKCFVEGFPDAKLLDKGKSLLAQLQAEIEEDRVHQAPNKPDAAGEIDELIYHLRDQCGRQFDQPGSCNVFDDARGEESPAAKLVKIGLPAVPKLIDAITDERPSRSVGFWRDYTLSHRILTVGDVACAVISRLSSSNFYAYNPNQTMAEGRAKFKAQAAAWWSKVQAVGEEKVLAEIVAKGEPGADYPARQLASRYPASLLAAVKAGVSHAKEDVEAADLASVVLSCPSPANETFAKELHLTAKGTALRVAAAKIEAQFDVETAVRWALQAWKSEPAFAWNGSYSPTAFLIGSRSVSALEEMSIGLKDRPSSVRFEVVRAVVEDTSESFPAEKLTKDPSLQRKYETIVEALLVKELFDEAEISAPSWKVGGWELSAATLGELACADLAVLFPKKYHFEKTPSFFEKRMLATEAANLWRKAQGLPALPPPTRPMIPTVADGEVDVRIAAVCQATSPSQLATAKEHLGALGLPAVSRIVRFLASEPSAPHAAELDSICRDLANIVRAVELSPDFRSNPALVEHLNRMKGKPLEPDFLDALLPLLRSEGRARAYSLRVQRDNDGRGVALTIEGSKERPMMGGMQFMAIVDGGWPDAFGGDIEGDVTTAKVRRVLASPPFSVYDIRVGSA